MTDNITLVGVVATPPKSMQTSSGLSIVTFRLASSQRRYDRTRNIWVDADTNWYSVTAFRQLADNACASLSKGDRVIVSGRLRVRAWENGERSGTAVEVDADALGPDLLFGTTSFTRVAGRPTDSGAHEAGAAGETAEPSPEPEPSLAPESDVSPEPAPGSERLLVGAAAAGAPIWHPGPTPGPDEAPF